MLEQLFKFPIVMVDGDNEERKIKDRMRFGDLPNSEENPENDEYDMVFGEAEYPYWDLIGMEDRWLPSRSSFKKAMAGKFEGTLVKFVNVGNLLVPWTKKKFKAELIKFIEEYNLSHPKENRVLIKTVPPDKFEKIKEEIQNGE